MAFERGNFTSYSACGIPYFVGGIVDDADRLVARSPETFRKAYQIDVRLHHEVTEIDLARRSVRALNRDRGAEYVEAFDSLVVA